MFHITKSVEFDSAHKLRDYVGKCANLHGHTYQMIVCLSGEHLMPNGMLYDFGDLKTAMAKVVQLLDHHYLNEIPPFDEINPTAENIAYFAFQTIKVQLHQAANQQKLYLKYVEILETSSCSARYSEEEN